MNCSTSKKKSDMLIDLSDNCPKNDKCTIVLHKNKSLNIKIDETGAKYFQLLDNEITSVIEYTYQKKVDETLQDANYTEDVIFEIPNDAKNINLVDKELQSTKMIFGRHCYCKGQAGYFNVMTGKLKLTKDSNQIYINLEFEVNEVPQEITSISKIIKL